MRPFFLLAVAVQASLGSCLSVASSGSHDARPTPAPADDGFNLLQEHGESYGSLLQRAEADDASIATDSSGAELDDDDVAEAVVGEGMESNTTSSSQTGQDDDDDVEDDEAVEDSDTTGSSRTEQDVEADDESDATDSPKTALPGLRYLVIKESIAMHKANASNASLLPENESAVAGEESSAARGISFLRTNADLSLFAASGVNLTGEGLGSIVALQNTTEMQVFIHRLLRNGARVVRDEVGLKNMAKRYSAGAAGSNQTEALQTMKEELSKAWWIGEGRGKTATLDGAGFEQVAALNSSVQMRAFLRRVVNANGREVRSNAMIDNLGEELAGVKVKGRFPDLQNLLHLPRFTVQGPPVNVSEVPLTEDGYQRIASQKDDEKMKSFVKRILATEGRSIKDEASLNGFVPFYSGVAGSKDLWSLRTELRDPRQAKWIYPGIGRKARLKEDGYQQVADTRDSKQMKAFIRRLATRSGRLLISDGALTGMVPYFSGEVMTQPYAELKKSLAKAMAEKKALEGKD